MYFPHFYLPSVIELKNLSVGQFHLIFRNGHEDSLEHCYCNIGITSKIVTNHIVGIRRNQQSNSLTGIAIFTRYNIHLTKPFSCSLFGFGSGMDTLGWVHAAFWWHFSFSQIPKIPPGPSNCIDKIVCLLIETIGWISARGTQKQRREPGWMVLEGNSYKIWDGTP